ncbi:MAG: hypothetical protein WCQ53_07845 [bacterium]
MRKFLVLSMIMLTGSTLLAGTSAKKRNTQKFVCPIESIKKISYKTEPFNGVNIIAPSYDDGADLYMDKCPSSIAIDDKDSLIKKHILWLSTIELEKCIYGAEANIKCYFAYSGR